jgi:alpha-mannosidase
MVTLAERLYVIRSRTGGVREKQGFEWTFGTPEETLRHIALPGRDIRRILGETGFALKLSAAQGGRYDNEIGAALGVLEESLDRQGVLTRDSCAGAEREMLPLEKAAKEYTLLCAAHAHIDMNWMWGWQETVAVTLATFRTVLGMMEEYPDFTFSQSQASVYRIVERYDPDLMDGILARIKEGRWEVNASTWVEPDKNMPCAESLLRQIRHARDYLASVWKLDPASLCIDFSPDAFGHSANIPEIDAYGGVKYLYHWRGLEEWYSLYRWRSRSGSELLCYCEPYSYNGGITADIALSVPELSARAGGLKTGLAVYGVGDHGGGPTRRDIEAIVEMAAWPVFPRVRFGTFSDFFRAAETVREKLPLLEKEINFFAAGCYSTQSRIKLGNRRAETALLDAEAFDALGFLLSGKRYDPARLEEAWRGVLFNHFHDIITGSCVRDSREYAMGFFAEAQAVAGTAREKASRALAALIDTSAIQTDAAEGSQSEGAGAGYGLDFFGGVPNPDRGRGRVRIYHVFNPSAHARRSVVECTVWDWTWDLRRAELRDYAGKPVPFQLLDKEPKKYWEHCYIRFLADLEVPAFGYTTIVFSEAPVREHYPSFYVRPFPRTDLVHNPAVLENGTLRAEFDPRSGALRSLRDKLTGREYLGAGRQAGLAINWIAKETNNAWLIGRCLESEPVGHATRIRPFTGCCREGQFSPENQHEEKVENPLRRGLLIEQETLGSRIKTVVSLDQGARALAYQFSITWNESEAMHDRVPVLCFDLPLSGKPDAFQSDIPGGVLNREGGYYDIPGLHYTAAVRGAEALALVTDSKYGYRGCGETLSATFINTAGNPDPFPERGEHAVKLWIHAGSSEPKALIEAAEDLCREMSVISGGSHAGSLAPEQELLRLDGKSAVLSSAGLTADGKLLVRLYETAGREDTAILTLPADAEAAELVDLDGRSLGPAEVRGKTVRVTIPAGRIAGVRITLRQQAPR